MYVKQDTLIQTLDVFKLLLHQQLVPRLHMWLLLRQIALLMAELAVSIQLTQARMDNACVILNMALVQILLVLVHAKLASSHLPLLIPLTALTSRRHHAAKFLSLTAVNIQAAKHQQVDRTVSAPMVTRKTISAIA